MCQYLRVPEDSDAEQVRKKFDNEMGVSGWTSPGRPLNPQPEIDEGAPLWWQGDEDASQSFLASQGIRLT